MPVRDALEASPLDVAGRPASRLLPSVAIKSQRTTQPRRAHVVDAEAGASGRAGVERAPIQLHVFRQDLHHAVAASALDTRSLLKPPPCQPIASRRDAGTPFAAAICSIWVRRPARAWGMAAGPRATAGDRAQRRRQRQHHADSRMPLDVGR